MVVSDLSTEEKIMQAARKVFTNKGYAATRTRDIAEESGINLALLNYYFRSKEKLFELVMIEKMKNFFGFLQPILYDETTSLEVKLETISGNYLELLMGNADLPFFILGEAKNNPGVILKLMKKKDLIKNSVFIKQVKEKKPKQDPYQFLLSFLGMCIFPFIMKPVFQKLTETSDKEFEQMMTERKKLIPAWSKAIINTK